MHALQVHFERDERVALFLDLGRQPQDFLFVHQELAGAFRLVVEPVSERIQRDVDAVRQQFAAFDPGETVLQLHAVLAAALHLGPDEHDARLAGLHNLVVVERLAVAGDDGVVAVLVFVLRGGHGLASGMVRCGGTWRRARGIPPVSGNSIRLARAMRWSSAAPP